MSPLIIVGILISTALADVSHVLSGSAHPPPNPSDVNSLAGPKSAFQTGNPQDFWWMASNSPLKASYDYYKKCSSKGNCLPPINVVSEGAQITKSANSADANFGPIDVKKNPFLNGDYQSGSVSSSSSFSSSGCTACASGSKSNGVAAFHSGTKIDITNNPFLNGQIATAGNGETIKSENGFLGVQPKKPGFATSHPLSNKKPFATSPPFGQQSFVLGSDADKVECKGNGYICTAKELCVNGVVNKNGEGLFQVRSDVQYCNANTEECCRLANGSERPPFDIILPTVSGKSTFASNINDLVDISAGKSSVTGSTLKFFGGAGSSPGQIQVLLDQSADVKPQVHHVGESGSQSTSNKTKPIRDITPSANSVFSSTVDYSDVQFPSDVRFASTIRGPAYLPPIGGPPTPPSKTPDLDAPTQPGIITYQPSIPTSPRPIQTTPRLCPPDTFLTPSGICETRGTPAPTCPFGTIQRPDGSCVGPTPPSTLPPCPPGKFLTASGSCEGPKPPTCPFGTIQKADGSCERPIPTPKSCPPGTFLIASGLCEAPSTPSPSCPYGTIRSPDGICEITPSTPGPCPPGTFQTPSGSCEAPTPRPCPFGTIQKADGTCERPIPTPRPCPPGTFLTASGSCEPRETPTCPFGTVQGPEGICKIPTPLTTLRSCPLGTHLTADGNCIKLEISTTPQPCPPGTFLTASGICESPRPPTPRPSCPPGTFQVASGACEYPTVSSTTTGYNYSKPCPPGTFKTPAGLCERPIVTTSRPQCPLGTYLTPSGSCETSRPSTPKPPPRPFETTASREYLPPVTPTQPTTTPRPADGYIYNKPTPTFGYPSSTLIPNSNSINQVYVPSPTTYLPPDESTEAGSNTEVRIPHRTTSERPSDVTGESVNSVTRVLIPATRKPPIYNGEQNEAPPAGCAAALKCVQEIYCTADGFVSPVPVVLTKDQELLKVPTTVCKDEESGIIGKCCRDPNYKDPWPSANLVNGVDDGQYKEDNLYGQRGIGNNRLVRSSKVTRSSSRPVRNSPQNIQGNQPTCGGRNHNTKPLGPGPIDANFAEYPWQAMILRDSNRSLLCGGAIIRRNAVLTAAHCVEGLDTSDVLIKGGEWKLGIDEEPLPFQIVKVAAILRHPGYKAGSYENDLAVLVLQEKLRPSKNVGAICLPQPNQIPTSNCIATGWGKRILQLHAKGALMHHIKVNVMDSQQCQQTLQHFQDSVQNYSPNTLCGFSDIDQCKVDYGSALACSDDQGHYTLSGIYAWDTGCKQEGQIGGYVAPDVEWIDFTLAKSLKDLKKLEKEYLLKSSRVEFS